MITKRCFIILLQKRYYCIGLHIYLYQIPFTCIYTVIYYVYLLCIMLCVLFLAFIVLNFFWFLYYEKVTEINWINWIELTAVWCLTLRSELEKIEYNHMLTLTSVHLANCRPMNMSWTSRQLRARRALSIFKDVPLRTRRARSLYRVYEIAPFCSWFSTEYDWMVIAPFWLSTDEVPCNRTSLPTISIRNREATTGYYTHLTNCQFWLL